MEQFKHIQEQVNQLVDSRQLDSLLEAMRP